MTKPRDIFTTAEAVPYAVRCPHCGGTAADWTPPDRQGIRWAIRDIRADGCARCRMIESLTTEHK